RSPIWIDLRGQGRGLQFLQEHQHLGDWTPLRQHISRFPGHFRSMEWRRYRTSKVFYFVMDITTSRITLREAFHRRSNNFISFLTQVEASCALVTRNRGNVSLVGIWLWGEPLPRHCFHWERHRRGPAPRSIPTRPISRWR